MSNSSEILFEHNRIINTITSMVTAADLKNWDACKNTFTESVLLDHDSAKGTPEIISSSEMIKSWETAFKEFDATWHSVTNFRITIDGDRAVCCSYVHAIHRNSSIRKGACHYTEYGLYTHELKKISGDWKISAVKYRMVFSEGNSSLFKH